MGSHWSDFDHVTREFRPVLDMGLLGILNWLLPSTSQIIQFLELVIELKCLLRILISKNILENMNILKNHMLKQSLVSFIPSLLASLTLTINDLKAVKSLSIVNRFQLLINYWSIKEHNHKPGRFASINDFNVLGEF